MKITNQNIEYNIRERKFSLKKDEKGIVQITCEDINTMAFATGLIHALDRPFQLESTKLVCQGRLSEKLKSSKENLEIDTFMRGLNLYQDIETDELFIKNETRLYLQAYCDGIDYIFNEKKELPSIFRFFKYVPEAWKISDIMAITKLIGYMGLAQSQQDIEKVIIQSLKKGCSLEKLQSIFKPHLDEITNEQLQLISKVRTYNNIIPNKLSSFSNIPLFRGSNNWVINGKKSLTKKTMHSFDPHLECNRLPSFWYEFTAKIPNNHFSGINIPGIPGLIMGRTQHTSFSFTYGFIDTIDYFFEDIKEENYLEFDQFRNLEKRTEIIVRKKKENIELSFFSTPNGVIESDPNQRHLRDGLYLSRGWSGNFGASGTLNALFQIQNVKDSFQAQSCLKEVSIPCNWLIADTQNNIAFQQSGRTPIRSHSGLYPIEGWLKGKCWQGYIKSEDLSHQENPECGYIITANDALLIKDKPLTVNLSMGRSRRDRIENLIRKNNELSIDDHKFIQNDLFSLQAERYIDFFKKHLPTSPHTITLINWNLKYDKSSKGAVIFEKIYTNILSFVFGDNFLGHDEWKYLHTRSAIVENYFHYFDRIILDPTPAEKDLWFDGQDPFDFISPIIHKTILSISKNSQTRYGKMRQVVLKNIFSDSFLSFFSKNHQAVAFEGSRTTINYSSLYRSHGRLVAIAPSYRFITDMGTNGSHTILAGGQSEFKNSTHYRDQVEMWLSGKYKIINPTK